MEEHVCDKGTVVRKAVDPGQALIEHRGLDPGSVFCKQVCKLAVVAVYPLTPIGKRDRTVEHKPFKRFLCFIGQRPFLEPFAPER